ncbi:MAG TPA: energy transducer TonB [Pyrinomonadaceae bacterium]|jgi:TonB family protein|nr:energy transducer TonB [Pyrinomonadaceae bacterium]
MSEKTDAPSHFDDDVGATPRAAARSVEHAAQTEADAELKALLGQWRAPSVPDSLDSRVVAAFRQQTQRAPLWKRIFSPKTPSASANREVIIMKQCSVCREEFADKFSFCPVDGSPLNELAASIVATPAPDLATAARGIMGRAPLIAYSSGEYHLTIMEDQGIINRLREQLREVAIESRLTWPEFRRDPAAFVRRSASGYGLMAWRFLSSPNVAVAALTAIVLVLSLSIGLVMMDRWRASREQQLADKQRDDLDYLGGITDIPAEEKEKEKGTAGMNKGTGGGSKPKQDKPGGGGGGGREEQKPASAGKLPQASLTIPQVVAPDPHPNPIKNPSLPVAATIDADPLLFPTDTRAIPYGDPKSKSTELSSGPGTGNGIGTGTGGGVGSGEGGGVGPGRGGNTGGGDRHPGGGGSGGPGGGVDYNRIFPPKDVTQKARILSRPEPQYTEEARRNQISGTVVLKAVFSSSGQVTNIRAVTGLPFGLTERAIAAARQIRFTPAMKDGRAVSQYIQIEYNFNLY